VISLCRQMRCAALQSMVKTDWTLEALLLRTTDADASVRITAYHEFERAVAAAALPPHTRERLLVDGMRDREESVRTACLSLMCAWAVSVSWDAAQLVELFPMPQAEQHVVALLFKLYTQALTAPPPTNKITSKAMLPSYCDGFLLPSERAGGVDVNKTAESQVGPRDRWLGLQKLCSFTPWGAVDGDSEAGADLVSGAAVSVAAVAAWQARCTWLRSQGQLPAAQRELTPGAAEELLDGLAPSLTSVCRMLLDVMDSAQGASTAALGQIAAETNGLLLQLVRLGQACDSSDSVGAAHMQKLIHSLLVHRFDDSSGDATAMPVLTVALYGDATGKDMGGSAMWLGGSGLHQRTGLGTHIPGGQLTQACIDLLFYVSQGGQAKTASLVCSSAMELAAGCEAELARALHILGHFMATTELSISAGEVMEALQTVVVPALNSEDEAIKILALRCVSLAGLLPQRGAEAISCSDDFTAMHVTTLGDAMRGSPPAMELVAIQGGVDWLCSLSPASMALSAQLVKVGDDDAQFGELVLQHLYHRAAQCDSSAACALSVEGLCKLMFRGCMPSGSATQLQVIALLLAAYCVPNAASGKAVDTVGTAAGMRYKQCLATFLPNLALVAQENRDLLARSLPEAIRVFSAGVASDLAQSDMQKALHLMAEFAVFLLGIQGSLVAPLPSLPSVSPAVFVSTVFAAEASAATSSDAALQCSEVATSALAQLTSFDEGDTLWLSFILGQLDQLDPGPAKHNKLVLQAVQRITAHIGANTELDAEVSQSLQELFETVV